MSAMEEILSKAIAPDAPLQGQEFYHLRLFGEPNELGTRYCVRQVHAVCNDAVFGPLRESEEEDYFWILEEAEMRYAERRQTLAEKGFIYSDMEM